MNSILSWGCSAYILLHEYVYLLLPFLLLLDSATKDKIKILKQTLPSSLRAAKLFFEFSSWSESRAAANNPCLLPSSCDFRDEISFLRSPWVFFSEFIWRRSLSVSLWTSFSLSKIVKQFKNYWASIYLYSRIKTYIRAYTTINFIQSKLMEK